MYLITYLQYKKSTKYISTAQLWSVVDHSIISCIFLTLCSSLTLAGAILGFKNPTSVFLPITDDVREELVRLSVASGVLCRFTSFVAVDSDGQTIAKKRLHSYQQSLFAGAQQPQHQQQAVFQFQNPSSPTRNSSLFGSSGMDLEKITSNTVILDRMRPTFSKELPKMKSSECKNLKKKQSRNRLESNLMSLSSEYADDCDGLVEKEHGNEDMMMGLIESQSFKGSWTLQDISRNLKVDMKDLESMKAEVSFVSMISFLCGIACAYALLYV